MNLIGVLKHQILWKEDDMPGIILSLIATLIALSFAFHTDNWSAQSRGSRHNGGRRISKSSPDNSRLPRGHRNSPDSRR